MSQPEVETQPAPSSQVETQPAPSAQVDITQQATSPTPTTHIKNPKRVAAGKLVAERTRKAREEQKKAAASAAVNKAKAVASPSEPEPQAGLTLNQWIGIGGLVVSAAGLFFLKREEIMSAFKKKDPPPPPNPSPVTPVPRMRDLRKMG